MLLCAPELQFINCFMYLKQYITIWKQMRLSIYNI